MAPDTRPWPTELRLAKDRAEPDEDGREHE